MRKLAAEAFYIGPLDPATARAIREVRGPERCGVRTGNWLTKREAEQMVAAPAADRNQGKRDRAILAVLIGCGLRRDEAARLTLEHIRSGTAADASSIWPVNTAASGRRPCPG